MSRINQNQFSNYPDGMSGRDIDMMEGDPPEEGEGEEPAWEGAIRSIRSHGEQRRRESQG